MTEIEKLKAAFEAADADRNAALDVAYAAFDAVRDVLDAAVDAAYLTALAAQEKEQTND